MYRCFLVYEQISFQKAVCSVHLVLNLKWLGLSLEYIFMKYVSKWILQRLIILHIPSQSLSLEIFLTKLASIEQFAANSNLHIQLNLWYQIPDYTWDENFISGILPDQPLFLLCFSWISSRLLCFVNCHHLLIIVWTKNFSQVVWFTLIL